MKFNQLKFNRLEHGSPLSQPVSPLMLFLRVSLWLGLALVMWFALSARQARADTITVTVTDGTPNWAFIQEIPTGSGAFVYGPATPPLGDGSAQLTINNTGRQTLSTVNHAGLRFDQITRLQYSGYQSSTLYAVSLHLDVDYDLTDVITTWQGRLIFEPYMSGTVLANVWQTWDALQGKWWASGAPGNTLCPQSSPCTWAQVLTNWPNAGVRADVGLLHLKVGGPWPPFTGYADALIVGVNGDDTVYDFEPLKRVLNMDTGIWYPTIQSAIAAVSTVNGHTLSVTAGIYTGTVVVNKSLTIIGAGRNVTILDGNNKSAGGGTGVTIAANDVTLRDLTIQKYNIGIALQGARNVVIDNVASADHCAYGLKNTASNVGHVTIVNSDFSNNYGCPAARGIFFQSWAFDNITIAHSTVHSNGLVGIDLNINAGPISQVTISANRVYSNGDSGIGVLAPGATQVVIENNHVIMAGNQRFGIEAKNAKGNGAATGPGSYVIAGNYVTQTAPGTNSRDFAGIAVIRRDPQPLDPDMPTGVVITGNTVFNVQRGDGTCAGCNGHQGDGFGIVVGGVGSLVANNTLISNNIGVQVQAGNLGYPGNSPSNTGDANTPYFDRDNSPLGCATVRDNVFSGNDIDARAIGAGASHTPGVLNVNTGLLYCAIQAAIDAPETASGHTISVSAGVYTEFVTITLAKQPLTLQGAGVNATTIAGPNSGVGIYLPDNSDGVTITHLTVRNFQYGIRGPFNGGQLRNILIQDTALLSNTFHGFYSEAWAEHNVTFRRVNASFNNAAGGNGGRGIWLINGDKSSIVIEDSVFAGNGLVGIDISDGSVTGLTITNNLVQDNRDAGIGFIDGRNVLVYSNTLLNNGRFGIEVKNSAGDGTLDGPNRVVVMQNRVERTAPATDPRDHAGIAVMRRFPAAGNPDQPAGVVVISNTVSGYVRQTGGTGDGFGIVVGGASHIVRDNVVAGSDVGIQTQGGNPALNQQGTAFFDRDNAAFGGATLSGNTLAGNGIGVRALGQAALTATNNLISGSLSAGVVISGSSAMTVTIGGDPAQFNTFRNNGGGLNCSGVAGVCNVRVSGVPAGAPSINAYYNDWLGGLDNLPGIENGIWHAADNGALAAVDYYTITLSATPATQVADGVSPITVTAQISGLLELAGVAGRNVGYDRTPVLGVFTPASGVSPLNAAGQSVIHITSSTPGTTVVEGWVMAMPPLPMFLNPLSNYVTVTFGAAQEPIVSKQVLLPPGNVYPGSIVTYTVLVTAPTFNALANVVVTDAIPLNTTYVPGSASGSAPVSGPDPLSMTLPVLGAGQTATLTFSVQVLPGGPGTYEIENQAWVSNASSPSGVTVTSKVTFTVNPPAFITVTVDPDTQPAGGPTSLVTVTVADNNHTPLPGVPVAGVAGLGNVTLAPATDAAGQAPGVWTPGPLAGHSALTVTTGYLTGSAPITVLSGLPATITVVVSPNTLVANSGQTAAVTATIVDGQGNPLPGLNLSGVLVPGTSTAPGSLSLSGTTNAAGALYGTWTASAGSVMGGATISVTHAGSGVVGAAPVTLTAGAMSVFTITAAPNVLVANGISASVVTVFAADAWGNPLSGASVTLSCWLCSALGMQPNPVTLDANGVATSTFTAGNWPGTGVVTATLNGDTVTATIQLVSQNGLVGSLSAAFGARITYTLRLTNTGIGPELGVVITGYIPTNTVSVGWPSYPSIVCDPPVAGLLFIGGTSNGMSHFHTSPPFNMAAGQTCTLTWLVDPLSRVGNILNTATATSLNSAVALDVSIEIHRVFLIIVMKQ